MEMASDLPARTASTTVERQSRRQQSCQLASELEKQLLIDFALGKERNLLARRADGAFAGRSDAEGDATHIAQAHNHALLGVGFHDAFDHLARMIRGAILKKCHD
jgi:hypothetical protein